MYFLDSTDKWHHIIFVFLCLTSLSILISRSIHVATNGNISFFLWLSMEGMMLKLKLQYFGHLMRRVDSLEKTLMLGGSGAGGGDDRGWDGWMASLTRWTWVWVNSGSWWWTGRPGVLRFMGSQESDMTERLNWTEYSTAYVCVCVHVRVCMRVRWVVSMCLLL